MLWDNKYGNCVLIKLHPNLYISYAFLLDTSLSPWAAELCCTYADQLYKIAREDQVDVWQRARGESDTEFDVVFSE